MKIAEVSRRYGVSADTLRYYERIGLLPPVRRDGNGVRDYTDEDCGWVEMVRCFRAAGVQVEALIEYVSLFQQGDATAEARRAILVGQRARLAAQLDQMKETIERLDRKILNYGELLAIEDFTARAHRRMAAEGSRREED